MCSLSINSTLLSTIGKATVDYDALAASWLKLDRTARALRLLTPLALGSRLLGVASTGPLPLLCPTRARAHRDDLSGVTDLHRRAVEPERRIDAARVGEDDNTKPLGAVRDDPRTLDGAARAKGSAERRCKRVIVAGRQRAHAHRERRARSLWQPR